MSNATCLVDGCGRSVTTRGMCGLHYQRVWRLGVTELPSVGGCLNCGKRVQRVASKGPVPSYCSRKCRDAASYLRIKAAGKRAVRRAPKVERLCATCGEAFFSARTDARYCSKRCLSAGSRDSSSKTCTVAGCARPLRAREMCAKHYHAWHRAEFGRTANDRRWSNARRDAAQRRRARKLGAATGLPVERDVIAARDRYRCHLCGGKVNMQTAWPSRLSPSLDHVIPLFEGGAHDPSNVRLAHLGCNSSKGARATARGEQLMLIG